MAMWSNSSCLENTLIPKGKRGGEGRSTSNSVNVLRSIQLGIEVDVSVIKQNIGRDCFRITQKVATHAKITVCSKF